MERSDERLNEDGFFKQQIDSLKLYQIVPSYQERQTIIEENNDEFKRILIVDDEPYNLMAMKIVLEQAEQQLLKRTHEDHVLMKVKGKITDIVDQATNGLDAFENFQAATSIGYTYGIILMDCSMPIMDGYESSVKIRKYCHKNNLE